MATIRLKYKIETRSDFRDLDILELRSFVGLLLFTSICKSNRENLRSIFGIDGPDRDIFRCVTNANRLAVILSALRFDDPETRVERNNQDFFVTVSEFFNALICNCQNVYTIGFCACVEEMLVSFRGSSKFKMIRMDIICQKICKVLYLSQPKLYFDLQKLTVSTNRNNG